MRKRDETAHVKHLVSHEISQKEYKNKYGFTMQTPLAAKSLTKALSKAAKKRGLPENLMKAMEAKRQSEAETTTVPVSIGPEAETVKKIRKRAFKKKEYGIILFPYAHLKISDLALSRFVQDDNVVCLSLRRILRLPAHTTPACRILLSCIRDTAWSMGSGRGQFRKNGFGFAR